jgi:NAD(P)-dependent dehydrogenase (short-subunit alcohol dehydrogenase family)
MAGLGAFLAAVLVLDLAFPPPLARAHINSVLVTDRYAKPLRAFSAPDGRWRFAVSLEEIDPAFVEALVVKTSRLDGVVHNAAFVGTSELEGWAVGFKDQSLETWRRALEVNLTAPFHLTQLMLPLLEAASAPSVVTIGSVHGIVGPDWRLMT